MAKQRSLLTRPVLFLAALAPIVGYIGINSIGRAPVQRGERPNVISDGYELVFIFFTASFCRGNTYERFDEIITGARSQLRSTADSLGMNFRSIAVSVDSDAQLGLEVLSRYGGFDELISGSNWVNTAALRYMLDTHAGIAGVPQVVIAVRDINAEPGSPIGLASERVALRVPGADRIDQWYQDGVPLPEDLIEETQ